MSENKKPYTQPTLTEIGQLATVITQNGLYGQIDGGIVVIGGYGYSPHQSY